jgi:PPIC-type PPIASE domain
MVGSKSVRHIESPERVRALSPRRILREPLLHFLALGALLFALYGALNRGALDAPSEIVVDRPRLESLTAQFQRVWQRPPTTEELRGLVESFVREEVLYREGVALRLDRDDPVVRRRVGQKMTFLADAQAPAEASEAELQAWLEAHPDAYRVEPRYSLRQVYFDPARRGPRLEADVASARAALGRGTAGVLGDATLLPASVDSAPASELARVFGQEFADAVAALPVGGLRGPIPSSYGVHLVELRAREPGRTPALAEVRPAVERDLLRARADEAGEAFYQSLRQRYTVRIEAGPETGTGVVAEAR